MANKQKILLSQIDLKNSPRVRAKDPDDDTVEQYAENYEKGVPMPPIVLFYDPDTKQFLLADGRHRYEAAEFNQQDKIEATIIEGGYADALKHALLANAEHGVPRSNADKRQCVKAALLQWGAGVTDMHIAGIAMVSDKTVASVREEMLEHKQLKPTKTRTRSDGQEITVGSSGREEMVDSFGKAIPHKVQTYWDRRDEMQKLHDQAEWVHDALKDAHRIKDPMFAELNFTDLLASLEHIKSSIKSAIPFCVCTNCAGHPETQKGGCRLCLDRGLIGKFRYDNLVPLEIKEIMKKARAK